MTEQLPVRSITRVLLWLILLPMILNYLKAVILLEWSIPRLMVLHLILLNWMMAIILPGLMILIQVVFRIRLAYRFRMLP